MAVANALQPMPAMGSHSESTTAHPEISCSGLLTANATDKQSLLNIQELLTSIFIRNRNQHRRNHWFKSLQQFRKQLSLLLEEMDGGGKKALIVSKLDARLRYWDDKCIHQWYLHFTQLVAVGPFSMLGLVLMACTARTCRVTGITALYEEIGSDDMKMALQMIDDGQTEEELGSLLGPGEDEGEVIERW